MYAYGIFVFIDGVGSTEMFVEFFNKFIALRLYSSGGTSIVGRVRVGILGVDKVFFNI